jgi:hypothetical protein
MEPFRHFRQRIQALTAMDRSGPTTPGHAVSRCGSRHAEDGGAQRIEMDEPAFLDPRAGQEVKPRVVA